MMQTSAFYRDDLPLCTDYDVLVVGGEAAGCAAALAVQNACTPRQLSSALLQRTLRRRGAYLSDCSE